MFTQTVTRSIVLALSLTSLLGGCDPKGAAGALGASPERAIGNSEFTAEPVVNGRPGPDQGGITPTLPPQVDPLLDPIDPVVQPKGGKGVVLSEDAPLPWKLTDPAASAGCRCHLECGPQNDDGSKDCITICSGNGCG